MARGSTVVTAFSTVLVPGGPFPYVGPNAVPKAAVIWQSIALGNTLAEGTAGETIEYVFIRNGAGPTTYDLRLGNTSAANITCDWVIYTI